MPRSIWRRSSAGSGIRLTRAAPAEKSFQKAPEGVRSISLHGRFVPATTRIGTFRLSAARYTSNVAPSVNSTSSTTARIGPDRDNSSNSAPKASKIRRPRSEEHTSELQSRRDLVCRLLLEKKKIINHHY